MRLTVFQSFRGMLFSLVLLAVLPALGIILHNGLASRDDAVLHARQELVRIVTALAGAQTRTTDVTRQTLATLAIMDEVRNQNAQACAAIFSRILLHNPLYTNMALTTPDGEVVASAMPMAFASLADRRHFKEALRTKAFAPGEYIVSRATAIASFPFAYPILDERGEVGGVLTVALDLGKFHSFFAGEHLPDGSFLGIADYEGRRIFRSHVDQSFPLGSFISPGAWKAAQEGGESGAFVSYGSDGLSRISAFHKIRLERGAPAYMTIFVGMPEASRLRCPQSHENRADPVRMRGCSGAGHGLGSGAPFFHAPDQSPGHGGGALSHRGLRHADGREPRRRGAGASGLGS